MRGKRKKEARENKKNGSPVKYYESSQKDRSTARQYIKHKKAENRNETSDSTANYLHYHLRLLRIQVRNQHNHYTIKVLLAKNSHFNEWSISRAENYLPNSTRKKM